MNDANGNDNNGLLAKELDEKLRVWERGPVNCVQKLEGVGVIIHVSPTTKPEELGSYLHERLCNADYKDGLYKNEILYVGGTGGTEPLVLKEFLQQHISVKK